MSKALYWEVENGNKNSKETIEIKLTPEEFKTLWECFKDLKEIQPVVIDFEEK